MTKCEIYFLEMAVESLWFEITNKFLIKVAPLLAILKRRIHHRGLNKLSISLLYKTSMLTLINTNTMVPPIAPIGLDYIAGAVRTAGFDADVVDLCLSDNPDKTLKDYFAGHSPRLVGLSFRNTDDCFWPSAKWFVPDLVKRVKKIRTMTDSPIVIGGVGFSLFALRIVEYSGADFGVRGDGEQAMVSLYKELRHLKHYEKVEGLIWHAGGKEHCNKPAWPDVLFLSTDRDAIDNKTYFEKGGQCGLETKRGCNHNCLYCADPLAKGSALRLRNPVDVADEVQSLISQGVEVLHICDSEFNIPSRHAYDVCREFISRSLGDKIRWYTYMAVVPFDAELARLMEKAGCVGINFTGDSACPSMLKTYNKTHSKDDLASAIRLCRQNGIKVMIDLLLGGPGETAQTVSQTIDFIKQANPDCAGAPLGIRIYPGTPIAEMVMKEGVPEKNPNIRRKYSGQVDFFKPTFYIASGLGPYPAKLIKEMIAGDKRFFEPKEDIAPEDVSMTPTDHNYSDNIQLVEAIAKGERGAYWDILKKIRDRK